MGQKHGKEKRPSGGGGGHGFGHKRPSHQPTKEKRPSDTTSGAPASDASVMTRKGSSQQVEDHDIYAKRSNGSDVQGKSSRKTSSASDAGRYRMGSFNDQGKLKSPEAIYEDVPQQRKTLMDHIVAFYFRNDHERLMNGEVDVEGICDWALASGPEGIASLNEKLRAKYGEDLDSFLVNASDEKRRREEEEDDDEASASDNEGGSVSSHTVESDSHSLAHDATMDRPAIPAARRRPTNTMRFTVDANGELVAPATAQLDHAPPPDLRTQLDQFITTVDPNRSGELDRFVKFADEHGLIALNSELLVAFGRDLKGNTLQQETDENAVNHHLDVKKFGVGFDSPLLSEMRNTKLHHEDSGPLDLNSNKETGACNKFRLDTESPVFGMCKCGHERAAHVKRGSVIASGTLERKLAERRASINEEAIASQSNTSPRNNGTGEFKPPRPPTPKVKEVNVPVADETHFKPPPPAGPKPANHATGPKPANNSTGQKPPRPKSAKKQGPASAKRDGTIERLKPAAEKKVEPCTLENFQLDMSATEFGVCVKCGWKKQDHKPGSGNGETTRRRPVSLKKNGPAEPCGNYKLDLTADTFGACACGFPRSAHSGQSGSNQRTISTTLEKRWTHMREIAA